MEFSDILMWVLLALSIVSVLLVLQSYRLYKMTINYLKVIKDYNSLYHWYKEAYVTLEVLEGHICNKED